MLRLVLGLLLILSPTLFLRAQNTAPVFRSPADAGRSSRYRRNLIRYNEAWAIKTLQTLFSAEATYQSTVGNGNYGTLEDLVREKLISRVLGEGHRYGYVFRIRIEKRASGSPAVLAIAAVPRHYGRTGRRSFYVDETGVVVAADRKGAEAKATDDPLDP